MSRAEGNPAVVDVTSHEGLPGLAREAWEAFLVSGDVADLDRCLELHRQAGTVAEPRAADPGTLAGLAMASLERFRLRGMSGDLENAIAAAEHCLIRPVTGMLRARSLRTLAEALHHRYQMLSAVGDLLRALDVAKQAMTLEQDQPAGNAETAGTAETLVDILWSYLTAFGDPAAITLLGKLYGDILNDGGDERHRAGRCAYLWAAHSAGVDGVGLDDVIRAHQAILTEDDHLLASRGDFVSNLSAALRKRAAEHAERSAGDLTDAAGLWERVLSVQPPGTPFRYRVWATLADVRHDIYLATGAPDALDRSLACGEAALREADAAEADFVPLLITLGRRMAARGSRYPLASRERSRDRARAIELVSMAVSAARIGTSERADALHALAGLRAEEHYANGDPDALDAAIAVAEESFAIATFDSSNVAIAGFTLAAFLLSRDSLDDSGVHLERAATVVERCMARLERSGQPTAGLSVIRGEVLLRRYERTRRLEDLAAVIDMYEAALVDAHGDPELTAEITTSLGSAYLARHDRSSSAADVDRAVQLYEAKAAMTGDPNLAHTVSMLAMALAARYDLGHVAADLDRAIECLEAVERMPQGMVVELELERRGRASNMALFLTKRYERDREVADLHSAVALLTEAAAAASSGSPGRAELLSGLGTALEMTFRATEDAGFLSGAIEAWTEAWQIQQAAFPGLAASYQLGRATMWSRIYAQLVIALLDHAGLTGHGPESARDLRRKALVVAESAKSRILSEQMSRLEQVVPPDLEVFVKREHDLMFQQTQLDVADMQGGGQAGRAPHPPLPDGGYPAARQAITDELERLWAEMEMAGGEEAIRYVAARRNPAWAWADAMAAAKKAGEATALVSLFVTDESTVVFIHRDGWEAPSAVRLDLAARHWMRARELLYREVIRSRAGETQETWDRPILTAFAAVRPYLVGASHVVFSPMGAAHLLPWPVLLRRLARDAAPPVVSVLPTLTALTRLASRANADNPAAALVVGDPVGDLEHAADEAREVASVLGVTAYVGPEATIQTVREHLADSEVVHLATHADFAADSPYQSSLLLADGRLTVGEIVGLRVAARLVVLSACETAVADIGGGDSLTGLAQAFLQAGATGLVVSLWRVNDSATGALMKEFHAQRIAGVADAEALHAAASRTRDSEGWGKPYFWGPFLYIGSLRHSSLGGQHVHLTPPDGPAAQLWIGSLIPAENSGAETAETVERHRRGRQAGGSASTGGGSGLLPELPQASIGAPEVWRLQDVFDPDTIPKPIAASIATSDFYFCRLACSFRPERDETRIEWARFTLTLHPDDEGRRPIVFDLDPLEVADEVKHTRTVTIGPTMKFQQVDVSLGSVGFSFEYTSLTPEIWAAGAGEETAEWNFAQTRSRAVQGSKWMHALIKAPTGMTEVRAGLGIVADVASFGFLERLWGGPEKAGTTVPVILWPRA